MKLFHEINEFVRHKGRKLVWQASNLYRKSVVFNQTKGLFYLNSFGTLPICLYANIVKHRGNHPSQGYAANPLPPPNQVKTYPPYQKGVRGFLSNQRFSAYLILNIQIQFLACERIILKLLNSFWERMIVECFTLYKLQTEK